MHLLERTVGELIRENYIYARALHYLGIQFYNYEDKELLSLCRELGISEQRIVKSFYTFDSKTRIPMREIEGYPLDLTLEYLRYAHHCYIKEHLPYIGRLIETLGSDRHTDLQHAFPLFVEDFIRHIWSEEDTLFTFIGALSAIERGRVKNPISTLWEFRKISLESIHNDHRGEDEMKGLRTLIRDMEIKTLQDHVILEEIRGFDRELVYHAAIENDILLPQAIALEKSVRQTLELQSQQN